VSTRGPGQGGGVAGRPGWAPFVFGGGSRELWVLLLSVPTATGAQAPMRDGGAFSRDKGRFSVTTAAESDHGRRDFPR
jgi:hypothetical protein